MKSPVRLFAKILFLVVVVSLLVTGLVLSWFTSWRSDKLAELNSASEIAKTSAGDVEFLVRGEGPPVLVFHGAPGGYDQAMLLGSSLVDQGFQVIAPSRPGYLRTPLTNHILPEQQADAFAALLDSIGAPSVAVLGYSSGAPAAIQFALRNPNRVWALILISPVTTRYEPFIQPILGEPADVVLTALKGDIGSWMAVEAAQKEPGKILRDFLVDESISNGVQRETRNYVLQNSGQLEWFQSLIGTFAPLSPREAGARNDLVQIRALQLPLESLSVPVFFAHGTEDSLLPIDKARAAAAKIPNATFFAVQGGGHVPQLGAGGVELDKKITEFLRQYSGSQTQP